MTRSGGWSATALSAASPLVDDFGLGVAAALERVLDEPGDVLFVFDDEHAVSGHWIDGPSVAGRRFHAR